MTYQGDIAGSTNSIFYLTRGLAERGHQIFMGCRKESLLFQLLQQTKVQLIPMTFQSRFDRHNMRQIKQAVQHHQIELINAQSSYDRYTSVLAKFLYGLPVKVVHTRRQISASMGGFLQNLVYVKGTDKIVAVSQGVKDSLVEKSIPSQHIKVIYNGTPPEKYEMIDQAKVASLRDDFDISHQDFVIGCVSRKKKQEQILKALQLVPFSTKTIFVGIEKSPEYLPLLAQLDPRHKVCFTGMVPADQILNYYRLFDLKILASTMEGLSQALLEAMALEVPVIATDFSGNREVIRQEENGFLFQDQDIASLAVYIQKIKNNQELVSRFRHNGKKTALEQFNIKNTLDQYQNFFQELINQKK